LEYVSIFNGQIGVMLKYDPAILQKIEFNPVLSEDRFKILVVAT
jgi:hypothetical protein